jgi:hypothetical protein
MLDDESSVLEAAQQTTHNSARIERVHAAPSWSRLLQSETEQTSAIATLVDRVELKSEGIRISDSAAHRRRGKVPASASGPAPNRHIPRKLSAEEMSEYAHTQGRQDAFPPTYGTRG